MRRFVGIVQHCACRNLETRCARGPKLKRNGHRCAGADEHMLPQLLWRDRSPLPLLGTGAGAHGRNKPFIIRHCNWGDFTWIECIFYMHFWIIWNGQTTLKVTEMYIYQPPVFCPILPRWGMARGSCFIAQRLAESIPSSVGSKCVSMIFIKKSVNNVKGYNVTVSLLKIKN